MAMTGDEAIQDKLWCRDQGFTVDQVRRLRHATWYRPDGLTLHGLPTDDYHRQLYRNKGWTLKPPGGYHAPALCERIAAVLNDGPASPATIAGRLGAPQSSVRTTLIRHPERFRRLDKGWWALSVPDSPPTL